MYDFVRARLAVVRGPLGSLPWAQWGHRGLAIHGLDWESVVEGMVHGLIVCSETTGSIFLSLSAWQQSDTWDRMWRGGNMYEDTVTHDSVSQAAM
jgi:hypothetical protein